MDKRASSPAIILTLLYFGYLLSFVDRMIFGLVVKPIKLSLHLSDAQIGLLGGAAFALSFALFAPLGGWLVDRRPRKAVFAGAITLWSLATFATGVTTSFIGMALARTLVGVGESVMQPMAVSLIADTAPADRRPKTFSIYSSSGAVGQIFALVMGGILIHLLTRGRGLTLPIVGYVDPWRGLFMSAGLLGLILVAVVLGVLRDPARHAPRPVDGDHPTALSYIKRYPWIILAVFGGLTMAQMGSLSSTTWSVTFFERVHHWPAAQTAIAMGLTSGVTGLIGCLCIGRLIAFLRRRGMVDAPLRVPLIAAIVYPIISVLALSASSPIVALILLPIGSFWGYAPSIGAMTALGEATPAPVRARLTGLHHLCSGIISSSIGPYLVGLFSDRLFHQSDGIRYAMMLTSIIAGVGGAALLLLGFRQYKQRLSTVEAS